MKNTIDVHEKARIMYLDRTDNYRSYHAARKMFRKTLRTVAELGPQSIYQGILATESNKGLFVNDNS